MKARASITVFLFSLFATVASAQATRTWVSGVGDDANPCSRTAPCRTFAGAISKTASNGEINVLDSGGFGAVTITKSITIDAGAHTGGVLVAGTNGIVVNAGPDDVVTLRNLDIHGAGSGINGIRFLAGKALFVERTVIYGFAAKGISFEPSGNSALTVRDTAIRNNADSVNGGGILVIPGALGTAQVFLERVKLDGNFYGLRAEKYSKVSVRDSSATGSTTHGFVSVSNGGRVDFTVESSVASGNGGSGLRSVGKNSNLNMSNVTIVNNSAGISNDGRGRLISFGNNRITNNNTDGTPTQTIAQQ